MNDDMLSQDEINALLQGIGDDDSTDEAGDLKVTDYLSDIEKDALGEIGNISFGSAATALSTLLNQKVDITTPELSLIEKKNLPEEFPKPHVAIHVEYTEGFEGMNLLVIHTKDASIIADLMLGGEGVEQEELTEMHLSAVQESMNQMMGSASTSMSTIFNKKVDISPPSIDLMDIKENKGVNHLPQEDILVQISFRLKVGELIDSKIMQLVSVSFAKKLVEDLMNPSASYEESPAQNTESLYSEEVLEETPEPSISMSQPVNRQIESERAPVYQESPSLNQNVHMRNANVQRAAFTDFDTPSLSDAESQNLNMLLDIPLQVTVELGRTKRSIKDILEFTQGSIIELDKLAGEPVDILVNRKLVAKGEVVVIDENFGVRVTDIISQEERVRNLK
ncbi:flagellar motor switch phosphatase FliY [Alkalihalobacillus trypoxylicola]|uniref:Flagellar motor switch protein FliN n=1 Tax=Alkalihalobacillus trypoxylicola TaxID=519424 RepID=A0A162F8L7_9BACI|nr:flagellar motor switch phosphatase FliY [Alkalihalobacillus trypoxylicola]KYG35048.1 flagellar motor switch protein FliN [Alkalihalobacillus trypoxylicola]